MPKVGVRIIHGNIEILSEFSKSRDAYYTWGRIIHGNLRYLQIAVKKHKKYASKNLLDLSLSSYIGQYNKRMLDVKFTVSL